jgi:hypothetical protein
MTRDQLEEDAKVHHGQRYVWMPAELSPAAFQLPKLVRVFDQLSHAKIMVISCLDVEKFTHHYLR